MVAKSCMPVIPSADLEKSLRSWVEGLGLTMDGAMRQDGTLIGRMDHGVRYLATAASSAKEAAGQVALGSIRPAFFAPWQTA